ncbi:MAG TPA: DUF1707 domain-containing protein, partial [Acidimicrobiales bacterium]|nr:DUF1707 domain-containing protein [Acidimicrobiales bacterium]
SPVSGGGQGQGRLPMRASNEDRERATAVLRQATADGYLNLEEFEERLDAVLRARYLEDLDPLVADIPGARRPSAPPPPPAPSWAEETARRVLRITMVALLAVMVMVAAVHLWWIVAIIGFVQWRRHAGRRHHHPMGLGRGRPPAEFI